MMVEDPIYDDESNEDHDDELNTSIWDVYEDDDQTSDLIFDLHQDHGFDQEIIFDEYLDYEEETRTVNSEQIDILDDIDSTDALEGVYMAGRMVKGANVINYVFD